MRLLHKCFRIWSGRWESNPRPKLGKLLYCHCTTPALLELSKYIQRGEIYSTAGPDSLFRLKTHSAFGIWHSAFGIWHSELAFGPALSATLRRGRCARIRVRRPEFPLLARS